MNQKELFERIQELMLDTLRERVQVINAETGEFVTVEEVFERDGVMQIIIEGK